MQHTTVLFPQNAAYIHDASIATDHAHEDVPRDEIVDVVLVQCMMTITAAPTTNSAQEILLCSFLHKEGGKIFRNEMGLWESAKPYQIFDKAGATGRH